MTDPRAALCLPCWRETTVDPGPPTGDPRWQVKTCGRCQRPTTYGLTVSGSVEGVSLENDIERAVPATGDDR